MDIIKFVEVSADFVRKSDNLRQAAEALKKEYWSNEGHRTCEFISCITYERRHLPRGQRIPPVWRNLKKALCEWEKAKDKLSRALKASKS